MSITDGWVELATPSVSAQAVGVPLNNISFITGNSILGNAQGGNAAVVALTPSDVRGIIDFDASVEAYLSENVLANNGGVVASGSTMTGILISNGGAPALTGAGIMPATTEVGDIGRVTGLNSATTT